MSEQEKEVGVPERMNVDGAAGLLDDFAGDLLEDAAPLADPDKQRRRQPSGEAEVEEDDTEAAGDEAEEEDYEEESDESDDEPEEYDDEDEGEEDPRSETYTVRVDGQEVEVTWDELLAGYSRTADYTRKTQAVANERKAFEQEQAAVRQEREEYGKRLEILKRTLEANQPEEPTDPKAWIEWKKGKEQLQAVEAEQARLHERLQQEWLAEQDQIKAHEAKLLRDAIPEWQKDTAKEQAEKKAMVAYALGLGFTEQDLEALTDHRAVLLLRRAMLYDELQEGRKAVRGKVAKSPTLKPGRPKAKKSGRRRGIERSANRLSKSGHVNDAAGLLESIMDSDDF